MKNPIILILVTILFLTSCNKTVEVTPVESKVMYSATLNFVNKGVKYTTPISYVVEITIVNKTLVFTADSKCPKSVNQCANWNYEFKQEYREIENFTLSNKKDVSCTP